MRYEDRKLEGVQNERDVMAGRDNELEREDDRELPLGEAHEGYNDIVMNAIRAILDRDTLVVNDLAVPKQERDALEALKAAVDGKDSQHASFVYAGDRQELLEEALAALQPHLAPHAPLREALANRVAALRKTLRRTELAQDDELVIKGVVSTFAPAGDRDDKDDEAAPSGSTLSDGPEVNAAPAKSTLSDGPEVKAPPARSSLADGPAVPELAPAPTSLGDTAEIDAAAKRPWWKIWQKA